MRRLALSTLAVAAFVALPANAEAQVSFGATAAYHVDVEALGVGAVVKAPLPSLHENVGIMGDFTWFFPDGDVNYFEVNGNLTYDFPMTNSAISPFALAGLVVARTSVDTEEVFGVEIDASSTDVGLNLGGGVGFADNSFLVGGRLELRDGSGFVIFGSFLFGG